MDQEQQDGQQQQSRWRPLLWTGSILAFLAIVICGSIFGWKWTGFTDRTLWDWLKLLLAVAVPAVLAYFGHRISTLQYRGQQEAEEKRAQDEALQTFLDQIGNLLLNKDGPLRLSKEGDEVRALARARTLTVLRRLDSERKGRVLEFLYEAGLVDKERCIVDLAGAELSGASLRGANLIRASLSNAYLSEADLRNAYLSEADLSYAYLRGANLRGASLNTTASAIVGPLGEFFAGLLAMTGGEANLIGVDLSSADLTNARGVTKEQLKQAKSLEGATMPNGQKYADWLKSKGRGDDGENSGPP